MITGMDLAQPDMIDRRTPAWMGWRWLPLLIFLIAVTARLIPGPRTIDDSYITYRYARNLLSGEGFVYNPGERVLGTTTPLYTTLMVLAALPFGGANAPFPSLAWLINAAADGLTCILLFAIGRRLGYAWAGLGAALVWAVAPFSVTFAIGGLETSVYILLLTGMIYAHWQGRHVLAALLACLALFTRPDALILIGLVALDRAWQIFKEWRSARREARPAPRFPWAEALVFGLPTLAWIAFSTAYFGSPLPHSIAAKSVAYRLSAEEGFVRLLQHFTTPFLEHLTFGINWIAVGMALYPFLFLLGAWRSVRTAPRLWPFAVYPWLYFVIFAGANPLIFRWYLSPPLPGFMLFILVGAENLVTSLGDAIARRRQVSTPKEKNPTAVWVLQAALAVLVVAAPVALTLRDWRLHPDHGLDRPAPDMAWYKLELLYRQAADELADEIRQAPGETPTLAAGDVGVLGFFSGARILDTLGLNSPGSTRYYPLDPALYVINYAIPPQLILDEQPDYVVILEVYGRAGLLKDERFWEQYRLRRKIPTNIYGSDGLLILERKDR
jgi:hypothetical protein